jgi:AcrR family transcriptional regulator
MSNRPATLREHVLEVASRLFYEKGVRNVGIDEIIKESGVARMTLYNNFGSKDQLVKEYLNRTSEKFLSEYREKIERAALEPRDRLVAAFKVLDEWFSSPTSVAAGSPMPRSRCPSTTVRCARPGRATTPSCASCSSTSRARPTSPTRKSWSNSSW